MGNELEKRVEEVRTKFFVNGAEVFLKYVPSYQ